MRVYVPAGSFSIRVKARVAVLDALRQGMSRSEAARHVGVSTRTVWRTICAYRKATGNADAFPVKRPVCAVALTRRAKRDAEMMAAQADGLTSAEIAARFGCGVGHVYTRFSFLRRETGLQLAFDRAPSHERVWGEHVREKLAQVEQARHLGLSKREIAQQVGISLTGASNYLARLQGKFSGPCAPAARLLPEDVPNP